MAPQVLNNLEVITNMDKPLTLDYDNKVAVDNSKEPRIPRRIKCIKHKYHFEQIWEKTIFFLLYC